MASEPTASFSYIYSSIASAESAVRSVWLPTICEDILLVCRSPNAHCDHQERHHTAIIHGRGWLNASNPSCTLNGVAANATLLNPTTMLCEGVNSGVVSGGGEGAPLILPVSVTTDGSHYASSELQLPCELRVVERCPVRQRVPYK